jgi:hypothetical protein
MRGTILPLPLYAFMAWFSVKARRQLYLLPLCPSMALHTRVYPKVSGLAAWSENCKWYSSLQLYRYFESLVVSFATITLCVASQRVFIVVYFVVDLSRKLLDIPSYEWTYSDHTALVLLLSNENPM